MAGELRIDHGTAAGTFSLDGGSWEVENNIWVLGDDDQCVVIDAPHDAAAIGEVVGRREVLAILCTHAHDDHVRVAPELQAATDAPILLHPQERVLWDQVHDRAPDEELADGQVLTVAGTEVRVLHTPGHSPGACCFHVPALDVVFTGDTLFQGGPGATGRSYSDFPTIVASITDRLLTLPPETVVHTGHGDSTTIGQEAPHRQEWLDQGH
ncbi:MBL fold metallo-hydrolase [Ornithinicoccus halotolerans]|uniref:MBL fold metallo-hydrolase n=1 Tax=Ornithinicoccus halotolerans TaxID=1748220 RepID=UPI0012954338|nr:MBL fold metallo-hydrolase [Ornithinicoccus halotolerans]